MRFLEHAITSVSNQPEGWFEYVYVCFNWSEALAWFVLAGYIWWRFFKYRRTKVEILYGGLVFLFWLTDVAEVYELTVGLFLLKVLVFGGILVCRHFVVREYEDLKYLI